MRRWAGRLPVGNLDPRDWSNRQGTRLELEDNRADRLELGDRADRPELGDRADRPGPEQMPDRLEVHRAVDWPDMEPEVEKHKVDKFL